MSGNGTIIVSNSTTWYGGTLKGAGALDAVGGMTITGGLVKNPGTVYPELYFTNSSFPNPTDGFYYYDPNIGAPRRFTFDGWSITNHGVAVFSGTLDLPATNSARFHNLAGARFEVQDDRSLLGSASFNNLGKFLKSSGTNLTTVAWAFNTPGTTEVGSGILRFGGTVSQVSGTVLTGGTWVVKTNAILDLASAPLLTTNRAVVTLDGVQSQFPKLNSLAVNEGDFRLQNGKVFSVSNNLINSGTIRIDGLSSLNVSGTFQQTTQATLSITLPADASAGTNTLVVVNGAATLDGTIQVIVPSSAALSSGQIIPLVSFGSGSGQFATLDLQAGAGITGDIVYSPTNASFRVLTAPGPLRITDVSLQSTNISVTWSGGTPQYVLQLVTNLSQTNWSAIAGPTTATNVLVPMIQPAGFMRVLGGQ